MFADRPRKISPPPTLKLIPAFQTLYYREKDFCTGRCRLGRGFMAKYSIRIGDVLLLQFISKLAPNNSFIAPMTAWTDSHSSLSDDNAIIIDFFSFYPNNIDSFSHCEILEASSGRDCTSIMLSFESLLGNSAAAATTSPYLTDLVKKQTKSYLMGRAVSKGLKLYVQSDGSDYRSQQGFVVTVEYVAVPQALCGLVGMNSIISWSPNKNSSATPSVLKSIADSSHLGASAMPPSPPSPSLSWTPAVIAIAEAFSISSPFSKWNRATSTNNNASRNSRGGESFATSGLLLTGPPGTGKTFAVKALQHLCSNTHNIQIYELNIPNIMASNSPLVEINSVVSKAIEFCQFIEDRTPESTTENSGSDSSNCSNNSNNFSSKETVQIPKKFSFSNPSSKVSQSTEKISNSASKSTAGLTSSPVAMNGKINMGFIIIDEIDALGSHETHNDLQAAIKHRIFEVMDDISFNRVFGSFKTVKCRLCFVGTSNRIGDIDGSFRRGGRLEKEILLYDTPSDRKRLISQLLSQQHSNGSITPHVSDSTDNSISNLGLVLTADDIDLVAADVAEKTGGYVTADLALAIVPRATEVALRKLAELSKEGVEEHSLNNLRSLDSVNNSVTSSSSRIKVNLAEVWKNSFDIACRDIPPSALRGIAVTLPQLSFDDVIGNDEAKLYLTRVMQLSNFKVRGLRKVFNIEPMGGVLLHGPPGNSKTRLITAAASAHKLPLITLSVADVYSPYVGDAEAEIRKAFAVARRCSPCVMFLDEIDALVTNRDQSSASGAGSNSVESRVLSTLLNEMDGVGRSAGDGGGTNSNSESGGDGGGIIVVAATNRLGAIDSAILRKGRFQNIILVDSPNAENQLKLVDYFGGKFKLNAAQIDDVKKTLKPKLSGAEIENLCREQMMTHFRVKLEEVSSSSKGVP